jgi:hypothetical protein
LEGSEVWSWKWQAAAFGQNGKVSINSREKGGFSASSGDAGQGFGNVSSAFLAENLFLWKDTRGDDALGKPVVHTKARRHKGRGSLAADERRFSQVRRVVVG